MACVRTAMEPGVRTSERDLTTTRVRADAGRPPASRLVAAIASDDRRRRIRLLQWFTAGGVYLGAALVMGWGVRDGWVRGDHLAAWCAFVAVGLVTAYAALRTGWSERLRDPAMTEWQIVMGVLAVAGGYLICGPMRTMTLQPLLLIFAFGAFALHWRRIAALTVLALAVLAATMFLQRGNPLRDVPAVATLPLDATNFAFMLVVLPALSLIAARLSVLRDTLRERREALSLALAEVQRLATTDELTGLANRRSMIDRLVALRDAGARDFCVAILDIDHFKRINDTLGHAQGDAVLWRMADIAGTVLPPGDVLARWGGEEFLLLMPGTTVDAARARLDALRRSVREVVVGGAPLTFSAGIARHRDGDDLSGLVLRADRAMYRAKEEGRDGVRVAD